MKMKCDYCGSEGKCYEWCQCAKCIDPEGYDEWKENCPEKYEMWIERKLEEEY